MYHHHLPRIIRAVHRYRNESALLNAMQLQSITESQFAKICASNEHWSSSLKLLVLSSRGILRAMQSNKFYLIYFCYFYELMPHFASFPVIADDSNDSKMHKIKMHKNLRYLMDECGFIPWTTHCVQEMKRYKFLKMRNYTMLFDQNTNQNMMDGVQYFLRRTFGCKGMRSALFLAANARMYADLVVFHGGVSQEHDAQHIIDLMLRSKDNRDCTLYNALGVHCRTMLVLIAEFKPCSQRYIDAIYCLWNLQKPFYWIINDDVMDILKEEIAEKSEKLWMQKQSKVSILEILKLLHPQLCSSDLLFWLIDEFGDLDQATDAFLETVLTIFCRYSLDWMYNSEIIGYLSHREAHRILKHLNHTQSRKRFVGDMRNMVVQERSS